MTGTVGRRRARKPGEGGLPGRHEAPGSGSPWRRRFRARPGLLLVVGITLAVAAILGTLFLSPWLTGLRPASPYAEGTASSEGAGRRYLRPVVLGRLASPVITECSGVVESRRDANLLWVHNDSGGEARLFAVTRAGTLVATLNLEGVRAVDFEDISIGPGPEKDIPFLFVADTGNNRGARTEFSVYRLTEPSLEELPGGASILVAAPDRIRFAYDRAPIDCEALAVHPESGLIYLFTKQAFLTTVYALDPSGDGGRVQTARQVATLRVGDVVTGGDFSPDGKHMVLRTYFTVTEYATDLEDPFGGKGPRPLLRLRHHERQGESICYGSDGSIVTVSEGTGAPIVALRREDTGRSESKSE